MYILYIFITRNVKQDVQRMEGKWGKIYKVKEAEKKKFFS